MLICNCRASFLQLIMMAPLGEGDAFFEYLYQNVAEPLANEDLLAHELQDGLLLGKA